MGAADPGRSPDQNMDGSTGRLALPLLSLRRSTADISTQLPQSYASHIFLASSTLHHSFLFGQTVS